MRDKIYRNMWYTIFKFRKYLNCETLEMFKYMHGTSFLMLRKIFELKKIFRNKREKICGTSYLNLESIWIVKYLKCLNICMVHHFFNVMENI
jgi:hypothetical protein